MEIVDYLGTCMCASKTMDASEKMSNQFWFLRPSGASIEMDTSNKGEAPTGGG